MDRAGIAFMIPVLLLSLITLFLAFRSPGETRIFGLVCGFSGIALAIVKTLMYTGRMDGDGMLYWTLNISFTVLFFAMLLIAVFSSRRKHQNANTA